MSETKWTPGPWALVDNGPGETYVCGAGTSDRIICDLAEPYYAETGPDETAQANVALILAAPDLMQCALLAEEALSNACDPVKDSNDPLESLRFMLRAAIAKAKGEQP